MIKEFMRALVNLLNIARGEKGTFHTESAINELKALSQLLKDVESISNSAEEKQESDPKMIPVIKRRRRRKKVEDGKVHKNSIL